MITIGTSEEPVMNCEHERDLPYSRGRYSLSVIWLRHNRFDAGSYGRDLRGYSPPDINIAIHWKNINSMDAQARHFGGRHLMVLGEAEESAVFIATALFTDG